MDLIEMSKYFCAEEKKSRWCCSGILIAVYSHVGRVYDYVQCSLTPVTSLLPPTATMHRYIVRLTSRHFKGYNFPPTRTKYVIAIRARNTFLLHRHLHHHCQHRRLCLCSSAVSEIFAIPLWTTKRGSRSQRDLVFLLWAPQRLSTNSPAGRYLINLWRRREFLVAQMQPPRERRVFEHILRGNGITLKPSRVSANSGIPLHISVSLIKTACLISAFKAGYVCFFKSNVYQNNECLRVLETLAIKEQWIAEAEVWARASMWKIK